MKDAWIQVPLPSFAVDECSRFLRTLVLGGDGVYEGDGKWERMGTVGEKEDEREGRVRMKG